MTTVDVSVVIPVYNARSTLDRSLQSIWSQTHLPREVILVDDGSREPLKDWLNVDDAPVPVTLLEQENLGASAARNHGIGAATSKFIAFLDADDVWFPDKLKIQIASMQAGDMTLCGHGYQPEFSAVRSIAGDVSHASEPRVLRTSNFIFGNPLYTPTVVVRRDTFKGFDARFRRVDDYKAWVENFQSGRCYFIPKVLAAGFKRPIGQSGLSGSIRLMHRAYIEVLDTLRQEGSITPGFHLQARAVEAIKYPIRLMRNFNVR